MKLILAIAAMTLGAGLSLSPSVAADQIADKAFVKKQSQSVTFTKANYQSKDKRDSKKKGKEKSRSQARKEAERRFPGSKVLKVQEVRRNGRLVYKVKLLEKSGQVRTVTIDGTAR